MVPCSFCPRRFKNQSALNGHMRLHGGYGLNHVPGNANIATKTSAPPQQKAAIPTATPSTSATVPKLKKQSQASNVISRPVSEITKQFSKWFVPNALD